jgi:predicted lipoprotein with Yx(FWY)xxD motif
MMTAGDRRPYRWQAWLAPLAGALLATAAVGAPAASAQEPAPAVMVADAGALGPVLTDAAGRTLYRFTRDTAGESTCYNACAAAWPPLLVDAAPAAPADLPGALGTTARTDGATQVTYNGQPLYYYSGDANPGDANGQGVGGVWFVVAPDGGAMAGAAGTGG